MKYLIIGNGVAGTEAALAIRKKDPDGDIRVLTESDRLYYYRPKVIDYLADDITVDKLIIHKQEHYDKNGIEVLLNTRAARILASEKKVVNDSGAEYPYDRLLLATGARSFVPPIKGSQLKGVFTLREIADADSIKAYCKDKKDVAVIGGGLLGLETAHSLARLGKKVTVIEFCKWLLPRQLDERGGAVLMRMLEEKGLMFVLDDSVLSIEGNGVTERISLKSGKEIAAGAVVIAAGIRCRMELAVEAGIDVKNGIIVDDHMRTSSADIYAAGDPIEHRGRVYGIWPAALEQGRIAGLNMAGEAAPYNGTIMANTLKVTGIDLYSAGDFNAPNCEMLVAEGDSSYKKLLLNINDPVGAIVLGDAEAVKLARKVIDGKANPEEMKKYF